MFTIYVKIVLQLDGDLDKANAPRCACTTKGLGKDDLPMVSSNAWDSYQLHTTLVDSRLFILDSISRNEYKFQALQLECIPAHNHAFSATISMYTAYSYVIVFPFVHVFNDCLCCFCHHPIVINISNQFKSIGEEHVSMMIMLTLNLCFDCDWGFSSSFCGGWGGGRFCDMVYDCFYHCDCFQLHLVPCQPPNLL